jgi:hypothetical protein
MLETFEPDDCCKIVKASREGQLDGKTEWQCPKCGMNWTPDYLRIDMGEPFAKHWMPRPLIAVF